MNKKAFTLAELLAVIVILFALFLIAVPSVERIIKNSKEKVLTEQIESIKNSMRSWAFQYQKPDKGESITLSLYQLKSSGLIELDIKNPSTDELFPNDIILTIANNDGIIDYNVDLNSSINIPYEELPSLTLRGNALEYVELGSAFDVVATNEGGVTVIYPQNFDLENSNEIDVGTYLITYVKDNNKIYRTVVVRDTTIPVITFQQKTLEINLNELDSYDYKYMAKCEDKSNHTLTVDTSLLPKKTGTYSIKYTCTDSFGNIAEKYRDVIVK